MLTFLELRCLPNFWKLLCLLFSSLKYKSIKAINITYIFPIQWNWSRITNLNIHSWVGYFNNDWLLILFLESDAKEKEARKRFHWNFPTGWIKSPWSSNVNVKSRGKHAKQIKLLGTVIFLLQSQSCWKSSICMLMGFQCIDFLDKIY